MRRTASTLFAVLLLSATGWVTPSVEARINLNGTYASTTARSCTVSTGVPFGIDLTGSPTIIPAGAFRQNSVDSGTVTFNADGTGTSTGRSTTMNISGTTGSILSISDFSVPFTYTVDPDGTVEISLGEVVSTILLGSSIPGYTVTVAPRSALLQLGNGANVLVSAPQTSIAQETLEFFYPSGSPAFTQYRICTRSSTFVRR